MESEVEKRGNNGKEEGKKRGFGKAMDVNTIMQLLWIVNCKCLSLVILILEILFSFIAFLLYHYDVMSFHCFLISSWAMMGIVPQPILVLSHDFSNSNFSL